MRSNERALRALLGQVQFDVIESAAQLALMFTQSRAAADAVAGAEARSDSIAGEIRDVAGKRPLNPALLATLRELYRREYGLLGDCRGKLDDALKREEEGRDAVAGLRNRERSLERALSFERRKRELERQMAESLAADELWLQRLWRERT